ncbi:MAG: TraR/DksA family transcriptional regulator [Sinobacteraceae bacterium]|nr:TraR/DksA family transcriptional regulator [Nevskiaceae bacterium]
MSDTSLIRARLLARRAELLGRSAAVTADLHHEHEPLVADFADQATQRENEEVLRGIEQSTRGLLRQVNVALERVDRGEYFRCSRCGCDIEAERLQAIPEADQCARCAAHRQLA